MKKLKYGLLMVVVMIINFYGNNYWILIYLFKFMGLIIILK